jgi:transglutaminase-like putative cysteine protease
VLVPALRAEAPQTKPLYEAWYEIRTGKGKLGSLHTVAHEIERDGQKLVRTEQTEELFFLRSGDPYNEKQKHYTVETTRGQVLEVGYSTTLSKKQELRLRGKVDGDQALFRVVGEDEQTAKYTQQVPWDPAAIGLYAQEVFFAGKKLAPEQKHSYKAFNLACNRVAPTNFVVKRREKTRIGKEERELTKLEQSFPKELYLSKTTLWLDDNGDALKMEDDSPLFGLVTYERVNREAAEKKFKPTVTDIESPIQVINPLQFKNGAPKELLVRVSLEGEDEPGTLFVQNPRQQVLKADAKMVELRLLGHSAANGKPESEEAKKPEPAPAEYLDSNFFIRCDDPEVIKLAKEAIGEEKDPRKQVRAIRRWVSKHVKGSYEVAFATADEVARCREGDCSEMGMMLAAMCRAVGIPSRVAFGLVYDPNNPGFGGHLWSEVYLDGRWETCDPTNVIHILNAAHLKVADYSLKGVLNPDELTAVRRVFAGRMKVEILESK